MRAHGGRANSTPPLTDGQRRVAHPMNAKAGEQNMKVTKLTQAENLEIIRIWRKQTKPRGVPSGKTEPGTNITPSAELVEATL